MTTIRNPYPRKADTQKTREVITLLRARAGAPTPEWIAKFYRAIPTAALVRCEPAVVRGPDGFDYAAVRTPTPGEQFVPCTLIGLAHECTERGWGAVLNPSPSGPAWVFFYGALWSLREYGGLEGDGVEDPSEGEGRRTISIEKPTQVILSAPSDTFLPPYARRVIRQYLQQTLSIEIPRVLLLLNPGWHPGRNLVFNAFREDYSDSAAFEQAMTRLAQWYLPPGVGLLSQRRESADKIEHVL